MSLSDSLGELIAASRAVFEHARGIDARIDGQTIAWPSGRAQRVLHEIGQLSGDGRGFKGSSPPYVRLSRALDAIDESAIRDDPVWNAGYEAGFADGANDESGNSADVRQAAQQALYWLEAERDSAEPGATRPVEIIRVLKAALGNESSE